MELKACLYCMSDSCLHLQAIELCLEHNAFIVCQSTQLNEVTYYLLNERAIFIPKNEEYHHYYLKKGAWNCNTCPKICKMSSIVQAIEIALKIGHGISTSPIVTSIEYPTISTLPIPLTFDEKFSSVYSQQISQGFQLPALLIPENQHCAQGYLLNTENELTLGRTGIILYLENDILEYKDHKGI